MISAAGVVMCHERSAIALTHQPGTLATCETKDQANVNACVKYGINDTVEILDTLCVLTYAVIQYYK